MIKTNHLAYYDQLTKLPNVYKFKQEVEERLIKDQKDGFILLFSVKSLSLINSTSGYEVGNQTLIEITTLFNAIIGNQGLLAKTGGNEFAIWMDQLTEEDCFMTFSNLIDDLKNKDNILGKKLEFHSVFARFKYNQDICVSLNISPSHIIDPSIITSMSESLERYSIPPDRITIEITEDILIKGIADVKPILKALRGLKLKISLDDFGTGYSSLNYLSQLEIDELKIDKSFIDQIEKNDRIPILIENIIRLSQQLELTVIAEGVETKEQSDVLNKLGCSVIQGYYYSKPEQL